jgi:hypothetical protein
MFRCTAKEATGVPRCYGIDRTEKKPRRKPDGQSKRTSRTAEK